MNVHESIEDVRREIAAARAAGKTIGLAPTMGALHEAHMTLIDTARAECDFVAVSLFVNPTQFAPGEDLDGYPRTVEADLDACRRRGVDMVFLPTEEVMYPAGGSMTQIRVDALSGTLCGRSRPGHFPGVCTVVAKLLNIVQPDRAYFGAKDRQQVTILRRMVRELNFPVDVVTCPTVREADGLAMSSRNAYLDDERRHEALSLVESLRLADEMIRRERPPAARVIEAMREHIAARAPSGEIDYVRIVDPEDLRDLAETHRAVLVALAVRFTGARLIDNILVDASASGP